MCLSGASAAAVPLAAGGSGGAGVSLSAADGVLIVAILALVVVRQFQTRRVRATMFVWVALLLARGLLPVFAGGPAPGTFVLVVGGAVSVVFGLARGAAMRVWRDGDAVRRRGGGVVLGLWLLTIACRLAVAWVGYAAFHEPVDPDALWLGFGVTLGVQQVVLMVRGRSAAQGEPAPRGLRDAGTAAAPE